MIARINGKRSLCPLWLLESYQTVGVSDWRASPLLTPPSSFDGRLETNRRLCLSGSTRQSERWDALQRKSWVDGKKCFDFSLFIGVRGVKLFHKAEYCGTPQSKEGRNREYKVCLNDRALRLLDHDVTWKSRCFSPPEIRYPRHIQCSACRGR